MRFILALGTLLSVAASSPAQTTLPGTKPLKMKGDLAAQMVAGMHKYLDRALANSVNQRSRYWKPDFSSIGAYVKSVEPNRKRLMKIIGVVDPRVPEVDLKLIGSPDEPALVAETESLRIYSVRWPVLKGMDAAGLLLQPKGDALACVVAVPDADQSPEDIAGLAKQKGKDAGRTAFALRLAEHGCQVLIPTLIDRKDTWSGNPSIGRMTNQPHREFVYRMAYEMGRHIIGYEVQKVLAAVDWFSRKKDHPPIGVVGYGEGGLIAMYSAAVDTRIDAAAVSGYFGQREQLWKEPIYRNVWGLLKEFGDANIAALIAPRKLIIEDHPGPQIEGPPPVKPGRRGAAPGGTMHFAANAKRCAEEAKDAKANFYQLLKIPGPARLSVIPNRSGPVHSTKWLSSFFLSLSDRDTTVGPPARLPVDQRTDFDPLARLKRQFDQSVDYTQNLLPTAVHRRDQFWGKMRTNSLEAYKKSIEYYRAYFRDEIIGRLGPATEPMNPRTRLIYETAKWKGYEVVLDLYDDVFCYGILLVPNDLKPGERRPAVVCQHGLEGRPTDVCNPKMKTRAYNSFGAQLADRGFIVFAPQNPYIGKDDFRSLVRKANPLGLSLYSFIVSQHNRIIDWLETLPFVDADKIAFYGLSYGGKVAMRIGALVERYCVVICSGDFNEWIWKNITLDWRNSYMFTGEYEMYEFDLGNTFNYAEMARLIAPRPFMVERGHHDGVGLDEWVAHEYARVRFLYALLKIPERTEIEFFLGRHEINGVGTFAFLHRHLEWPAP